MRAAQILELLSRRPDEFFERLSSGIDLRIDSRARTRPYYAAHAWSDTLEHLGSALGSDLTRIMTEDSLAEIEAEIRRGLETMPSNAPFPSFHNGDFRMGRLCYALARALGPSSVVETGVCYGVTSAFILKALDRNGGGTLYSIDLPPLRKDGEKFVGWLVPHGLRTRWRLSLGSSRRLLPRIAAEIGVIDFFLHDSLHTHRNISRELAVITPRLSSRSLVVADDIEGNAAFSAWANKSNPKFWAVLAEESKRGLLGVAAFASAER